MLFSGEAAPGCPGVRCITRWDKTSIRFCAHRGLPQRPDEVVFFMPRVQRQSIFAEDMGLSIRGRSKMNHGVRRQGFGARWGVDVGQTGGSGLSIAESGVASRRGEFCRAQPGLAMGEVMWCRNLPFLSPSSPLPAGSPRSGLNTHACSCCPVRLSKGLCLVCLLS